MSETDASKSAAEAKTTSADAASNADDGAEAGAAGPTKTPSNASGDAGDGDAGATPQASTETAEPVVEPREIDASAARTMALEAELAETKDQLMRAVADVQNARRRSERDRRDAEAYGGAKLARDLLPVYDNLDEALKRASDELKEREPGFFNGVELTQRELVKAFEKHKVDRIDVAVGDKFDPNLHQAMFEAPAPGAEPGSIIQVMQAGFTISERLLRPAMVGVAKIVDPTEAAEKADDADDA